MKRLLTALLLAISVAVPLTAPAEAASKRQPKVAICHYDEIEDHYVRIRIAAVAGKKHLANHEFDVDGDGVDCSALPDPTPDVPAP